ncbi:MAG: YbjN domain-containing protein [Pseudomonadota bacterium]
MRLIAAVLLAVWPWVPVQADGRDIVDGTNPVAIVGIVREVLRKAKLTQAPDEDPVIEGRIDDANFAIVFQECDEPPGCLSIEFRSSYDQDRDVTDLILRWNADKRFGRSFATKKGIAVAYDVNLRHGVTRENLVDSIELWVMILRDFHDHIDW